MYEGELREKGTAYANGYMKGIQDCYDELMVMLDSYTCRHKTYYRLLKGLEKEFEISYRSIIKFAEDYGLRETK